MNLQNQIVPYTQGTCQAENVVSDASITVAFEA